ncbi:unnamed protein product [Adineta steineri]|uniref:Uncharacterized protein n=1 Tax=Adineta steineri TaxID=433720 RepID=A0A816C9E5_9BILA|nr:unnamed protein product [Adineta steineri]CAF1617487.1 unnamed protein product [Adineta steineri]
MLEKNALMVTMLGSLALRIFTVIITFDERNLINKQRLEGRRLANKERNQNSNISHGPIFHSSFQQTQVHNIIVDQCRFISVDIYKTKLSNSRIFDGHLSPSNLLNTDAIENTILPNGTNAHDIPLIRNGNAD